MKQSFAQTGCVNISTANANLDGTGPMGTVFTARGVAANGKGAIIKSIIIKATGSTTEGMVRLYTSDGVNTYLYKEVYIPAVVQTGTVPAFCAILGETLNLDPDHILYASTQNAESFNVVANGVDWVNGPCEAECVDMQYAGNTGLVTVSTANPNLDGSGPLGLAFTAIASTSLTAGTQIPNITVKAIQTTTPGMVRIFIDNGVGRFLIREIPIPAVTQTGVEPAYRVTLPMEIMLQPGFSLYASTQNNEAFNILTLGTDYTNCAFPDEE